MNTNIKIVSPAVEISRFFQNEDPNIIIEELIQLSEPEKIKKTLFVFPEGILPNIYLEDSIFIEKILKIIFLKIIKLF